MSIKHLFLLIVSLHMTASAFGQQNLLLPSNQIKNFYGEFVGAETHGAIFFARYFQRDSANALYVRNPPDQWQITKIDKSTGVLIGERIICGDTSDQNSFAPYMFGAFSGSKMHYFYTRCIRPAWSTPQNPTIACTVLCYKELDTNFNVIVPETILLTDSFKGAYWGFDVRSAAMINNQPLCLYSVRDSSHNGSSVAKFLIVDNLGGILRNDTLPPIINIPHYQDVNTVQSIYGGQALWTGNGLYGVGGFTMKAMITDSNYNIVDTFAEKPLVTDNSAISGGWFTTPYSIVALPSGDWLGGGTFDYVTSGANPYHYRHGVLMKMSQATRHSKDTIITFPGKDSRDGTHYWAGFHSLVYNEFDHKVYYTDQTHMDGGWDIVCTDSYNYLQVICTDTTVHNTWRKFIYSGANRCLQTVKVIPATDRAGIVLFGLERSSANPYDTSFLNGFIYHIDSTTSTAVSDPASPITIRNRIATYPNPTTDNLTIDDILGHLAAATLTNMQGQLIYQKTITGSKAIISVKGYPPGLYMLRVKTTDGEVYSEKIVLQ